jgi:hypothetical protein
MESSLSIHNNLSDLLQLHDLLVRTLTLLGLPLRTLANAVPVAILGPELAGNGQAIGIICRELCV